MSRTRRSMAWDDPRTRRTRRHEHGRRRLAAGRRPLDPLAGHAGPHARTRGRRRGGAGEGRDQRLGRAAARAAGRRRPVGGPRVVARLDGHDAHARAAAAAGSRPRRARRPGGRPSSCGTMSRGRAGTRRTSGPATRSSRARSSRASTGSSSRSAPTSARTSARWWTGCSGSSSPTAAGTARPRTARRCRRSGPRSGSWKACWNSRGRWRDPAEVRAARLRGQEYLLERRLFRRKSTGEVIDDDWLRFAFPTWHYYDVLRGLDYLRAASADPNRASARRSMSSSETVGPTADGRSSGCTRARRISTWTRARAGRAAGTPCGPCECSTGPRGGGGGVRATGRTAQEIEA